MIFILNQREGATAKPKKLKINKKNREIKLTMSN